MPRKVASVLGLLGFAVVALIAASKSLDFQAALFRAIFAAAVMALIGYVAGSIAQEALKEAVNARMPLQPDPASQNLTANSAPKQEETK